MVVLHSMVLLGPPMLCDVISVAEEFMVDVTGLKLVCVWQITRASRVFTSVLVVGVND